MQKINFRAHLRQVKWDIEKAIPNPSFSGLAILDIEEWRPLWSTNWGDKRLYRIESIKYVLRRYPQISRKSARKIAIIEFNKAAA